MREGIREQPEKSESSSGELSQAQRAGNPATKRRSLSVNFLFSAVSSFRTFRKVFRSWIDLPGRLNSQLSTVPLFSVTYRQRVSRRASWDQMQNRRQNGYG
jgi:hypothetical protein